MDKQIEKPFPSMPDSTAEWAQLRVVARKFVERAPEPVEDFKTRELVGYQCRYCDGPTDPPFDADTEVDIRTGVEWHDNFCPMLAVIEYRLSENLK